MDSTLNLIDKNACILKVLCDMPMLEIDLYVVGQLNNETDVLQRVKMPSTKDDWIQIHQNEVCKRFFVCQVQVYAK